MGASHVGRGHGVASCVRGCPHQGCGSVGHWEGQTVGLSKQGGAGGPKEGARRALPEPDLRLHWPSLSWSLGRRS